MALERPTLGPESSLSVPRVVANPWIILVVLALGEFMNLLDTTIVNVALPSITRDLHASLDELLWVLNAYILVFAILLITSGRLGDVIGPKRLFLTGLVVFSVASVACGLAQSPNQLILFRVIQGAGAAILVPQTLAVITSIFPPEKRGAAFGLWGAVAGVSVVVGPIIGGVLTTSVSWRSIFFLNAPIGVIAVILAILVMPEVRMAERPRFDVVGVILSAAAIFLCIYGLIEGQQYHWGRIQGIGAIDVGSLHAGLVSIPTVFLASLILVVIFIFWESQQREPLLPLSLFQDRNYSIGNLVQAVINFCLLGLFLPLSLFLQDVLHLTAIQAGIVVVPNAIAVLFAAPIAGNLADSDRISGKYLLFVGLTLFGLGVGGVAYLASVNSTGLTFTIPLFVAGIGMGFTITPMTTVAMRNITPSSAGAASGFLETAGQVGGCLGNAVVGAVLETQLAGEMHTQAIRFATQLPQSARASFVNGMSNAAGSGIEGTSQAALQISKSISGVSTQQVAGLAEIVFNHAYVNAMKPALLLPVVAAIATAVLTPLMRTSPIPKTSKQDEEIVVASPAVAAPLTATRPLTTATSPIVVPRPAARIPNPPALRALRPARLLSLADSTGGERLISGTITIGRDPSNTYAIKDVKVSRRHAEIVKKDMTVTVRDMQSSNGTYVNEERVEGERILHDGDTVRVGETSLQFKDDLEVARPRLVAVSGAPGSQYPLKERTTIGRLPNNDIRIADSKASRYHAEITIRDGWILIRDLTSLNGTIVNAQVIGSEYPLRLGDTISIGNTSFVYRHDLGTRPAQDP